MRERIAVIGIGIVVIIVYQLGPDGWKSKCEYRCRCECVLEKYWSGEMNGVPRESLPLRNSPFSFASTQLNSTTPLRPSTHHSPRTHPIFNAPPPHRALPSAPLLHHVHDSDGRHHARQGTITTSYTSLMSYILTSTPARPRIHPNNPDNPQRLTQTCPPRRNGRLDFQRDPFPVCPLPSPVRPNRTRPRARLLTQSA